MTAQTKRFAVVGLSTIFLLLIPLVAMQFSEEGEVDWSPFDFMVAGGLIFCTGMLIDLVIRKVKSLRHRILLLFVVLFAVALIWIELAVGIFGSPLAGS